MSCPHRDQAFEACRWLIDTLKEVVPIWKKEVWADGTEEWVHPGMDRPPTGLSRSAVRARVDACPRLRLRLHVGYDRTVDPTRPNPRRRP